jgi:hypothetical protein
MSHSHIIVLTTQVEGTATSDVDYKKTVGVLEFADGETEKTVSIQIIDDDEPEEDEYVCCCISFDIFDRSHVHSTF